MPRVDAYPGDRVATQPLPTLRRNEVRPPESVSGLQTLGQGLDRFGAAIAQIREEQQQQADQLALTIGKRQFNELYRVQALSGPDQRGDKGTKGLLTMQGADPHNRLEDNFKEWDEGADQIVGQAKNPRQQVLLEGLRDNERARYFEQGLEHATREHTKYKAAQNQATLVSTVETAGAAAGTPNGREVIDNQIETQRVLIEARGAELGQSREEIDGAIADLRSKTHLAVIDHLLDSDDDIAATEYFERVTASSEGHPAELLNSDADRIREKLQVNSTDGEASRIWKQVWAELGPKFAGDTVNSFEMQQRARELAGAKLKVATRAGEYLRTAEGDWARQRKDRVDGALQTLYTSFLQRVPLAEVQKTPEYKSYGWEVQQKVVDLYDQRDDEELGEKRAAHNYARSLYREPYEDAILVEQWKELSGAGLYTDLVLNPAQFVDMPEAALARYLPDLSKTQFAAVHRAWADTHGNVTASTVATVDKETLQTAMVNANMPWARNPKTDEEKQMYAQVDLAVRQELVREQLVLAKGSGQKVVLTGEQQRAAIQRVLDQKAMMPGFWGPYAVVAATVKKDAVGKAYVPFAEMRKTAPGALRLMRSYIASLPDKAGTSSTRNLGELEIDSRYGGAMERAYAAALSGATQAETEAILAAAVGKYVEPARAGTTTRPATGTTAPRPVRQTGPARTVPLGAHAPIPPPASPPSPPPTGRPPAQYPPRRPHKAGSSDGTK